MKTLVFVVLALALTLPLRAQIKNGDFSDGISHWHGDGRAPADFASDNPLAASDAFTNKGMIIPLKHNSWTKVAQDFDSGSGGGVLVVTYKVSKDFKLSTKADDYKNVQAKLGWGWQPFNTGAGHWLTCFVDSTGLKGTNVELEPPPKVEEPQTIRIPLGGNLQPHDKSTITLAFPPGEGVVVFLGVTQEGQ